jgi:transposase
MFSIGLDVHQNLTALCQLDADGRVVAERVIRGGFRAVAEHLGGIGGPFKVCFEASCGYGTLYDLLAPIAAEVQIAHPSELKLIFRSKHKNDRNDARKLAKLLHMDAIPRVHVPTIDVRGWRGLIEHRRKMVDKRTSCKNGIRGHLRGLGIKAPPRRSLWCRKGIEWLERQELPTSTDRIRRASLLAELRLLDEQVKIVERELDVIGRKDWRVAILESIPGVGPRTAEAVAAYIDDPARFTSVESIGKYFGMVPSQDASAGRNRLGHITREGPATVRKMITQAAWQGIRRSPWIKAHYERIKNGQKQRTGTALIATGHKLLRIMLAMLRKQEEWREPRVGGSEGAAAEAEGAAAAVKAVKKRRRQSGVAALPPAASANCIFEEKTRRRGRGKGSAVTGSVTVQ